MRRLVGELAPKTMDDISLLSDEADASACEFLSLLYDKLINKQGRFYEGGEAEYWHDLTFYQSSEFYFAVVGGDVLVQEDPNQPGKQRIGSSSVSGLHVLYKEDFGIVPLNFMEDPVD